MNNAEYAKSLRLLADFYADKDGFPMPDNTLVSYALNKSNLADIARSLGICQKKYEGDLFRLQKQFGAISLDFIAYRSDVCTRKVVGTETVVEKVPVSFETREVIKEIVEWECPGSIL